MARLKPEHLAELRQLHDQTAALLDGMAKAEPPFAPHAAAFKKAMEAALLAQNLRGARMAARDIRAMLVAVPPQARAEILKDLARTTGLPLQDQQDKDAKAAARILARGRIRNDNEYYLLRSHLEQIEASPDRLSELQDVQTLLNGYRA